MMINHLLVSSLKRSVLDLMYTLILLFYKRESDNMKMNFAVLNDLPHNDAIIKFKVNLCIVSPGQGWPGETNLCIYVNVVFNN